MGMASPANLRPHMILLIFSLFMLMILVSSYISENTTAEKSDKGSSDQVPKPKEWPERLHALLVMNDTEQNVLQVNNLWYDWQNGLNVQLIQYQLGKLLHAVSWNNGTTFYYTLHDDRYRECSVHEFGVGILRPNWLEGANYLGQREIDGFLCNVWEKLEFVWYYEDVVTKRPVHWLFYNGLDVQVMTFEEVDTMLEDSQWQTPVYCFEKEDRTSTSSHLAVGGRQNIIRPSLGLGFI